MPKISEFFGVSIYYYREHEPPHFHARYGRGGELCPDSLYDDRAGSRFV